MCTEQLRFRSPRPLGLQSAGPAQRGYPPPTRSWSPAARACRASRPSVGDWGTAEGGWTRPGVAADWDCQSKGGGLQVGRQARGLQVGTPGGFPEEGGEAPPAGGAFCPHVGLLPQRAVRSASSATGVCRPRAPPAGPAWEHLGRTYTQDAAHRPAADTCGCGE